MLHPAAGVAGWQLYHDYGRSNSPPVRHPFPVFDHHSWPYVSQQCPPLHYRTMLLCSHIALCFAIIHSPCLTIILGPIFHQNALCFTIVLCPLFQHFRLPNPHPALAGEVLASLNPQLVLRDIVGGVVWREAPAWENKIITEPAAVLLSKELLRNGPATPIPRTGPSSDTHSHCYSHSCDPQPLLQSQLRPTTTATVTAATHSHCYSHSCNCLPSTATAIHSHSHR